VFPTHADERATGGLGEAEVQHRGAGIGQRGDGRRESGRKEKTPNRTQEAKMICFYFCFCFYSRGGGEGIGPNPTDHWDPKSGAKKSTNMGNVTEKRGLPMGK